MPSTQKISIIIPVFDEQNSINACISNAKKCCGIDCEIIVVDGNNGSTNSAINAADVIQITSSPGRATQMNSGAKIATGDILLFLHADSILPPNAGELIKESLSAPAASAGAFKLSFDDNSFIMRAVAFVGDLRTRIERVPYGDRAPFISRRLFEELGGYPEIPIMEDVELFQKIKKHWYEIVILDEKVVTSARRYKSIGPVRCFLRNWILRILHFCGVGTDKLALMYSRQSNHSNA